MAEEKAQGMIQARVPGLFVVAGAGFEAHVVVGQAVRAGERLITWSPVDVAAAGYPTICPVVALQASPDEVSLLLEPGETVAAGQPLLDWAT